MEADFKDRGSHGLKKNCRSPCFRRMSLCGFLPLGSHVNCFYFLGCETETHNVLTL